MHQKSLQPLLSKQTERQAVYGGKNLHYVDENQTERDSTELPKLTRKNLSLRPFAPLMLEGATR